MTIDVDQKVINVYNKGGGIPLVIQDEEKQIYLPAMIFRHFLTYDGTNRYGTTLTNIFSTKFTIETTDGNNEFIQV